MPIEVGRDGGLAWASAGRPRLGGETSGDLCRVLPFDGGVLVAMMDGLGHGPEAREAALAAAGALAADAGAPLPELFERADLAAKRTRGLALSLVQRRGRALAWAGVGNVEGRLLVPGGRTEGLPLVGGVVGRLTAAVRVREVAWSAGSLLLLATDGLAPEALSQADTQGPLGPMVGRVLVAGALARDDALVLAARREAPRP